MSLKTSTTTRRLLEISTNIDNNAFVRLTCRKVKRLIDVALKPRVAFDVGSPPSCDKIAAM